MAIRLKQHIELEGTNPLDAIVDGHPRIKAYLVASLALNDGVDAAAAEDKLTQAEVYAALAFYHEHEEAIHSALEAIRGQIRTQGGFDRLDEIRRRKQSK